MSTSVTANKRYWDEFYSKMSLSVPSQFCAMLAVELPAGSTVVELGCGNGRDSLYLASRGVRVAAIDLSAQAIEVCQEQARAEGLDHAKFIAGTLVSSEDIGTVYNSARTLSDGGSVVSYSRFVMHSINDEQEALFMDNIAQAMRSGEQIFFEFRSKEDAELEKTFGNHYRRFVDTDQFIQSMQGRGFTNDYAMTGQGMARYKVEDPVVSRLIFTRD